MMKRISFPIMAALAIATTACGNNNTARNNTSTSAAPNTPAADQRRGDAATPITVTGCLQQDGRTYIVTRLNEPSREGVGTTGNGAAVEREQLRQAVNAYRLDAKEQTDWEKMVGKQVHVSGSIEKSADLPSAAGSTPGTGDRTAPTTGSTDTDHREKIDKGDLAQIAVSAMTVVSDNCGGDTKSSSPAQGAGTKKPASGKTRR